MIVFFLILFNFWSFLNARTDFNSEFKALLKTEYILV